MSAVTRKSGAWVVGDAVSVLEVGGDQLTQLEHAAVGGVVRLPGLQACDRRPCDRLGRGEVGLADGEADDILHLGQHVEEAPDAGRRHGAHAVVQEVGRGTWRLGGMRGHSADSVPSRLTRRADYATGSPGTMDAGAASPARRARRKMGAGTESSIRTASTTTTCSRPVISRLSHSTLVRCSSCALAQTQTAVLAPLATSCRMRSPNVSSLLDP